jgi:hypothetical protein
MTKRTCPDIAYLPPEDVVARTIEGEVISVPLASGIGDVDDALYTLNETGKPIWEKPDGTRTFRRIVAELSEAFDGPDGEIERDVVGIVTELLKRRLLVEA